MSSIAIMLEIDAMLKAAVDAEAARGHRSSGSVRHKAAEEYLARKASLRELIARLGAKADKGEFISDEATTLWFDSLGNDHKLPEPEADVFLHRSPV